jgi:hypothetical protein
MKKIIILTFLMVCGVHLLKSQTVTGIVYLVKEGVEKEPLPYATVYWPEARLSFETDAKGRFSFNRKKQEKIILIASYIGYTRDTVILDKTGNYAEFNLKENNELNAVKIVGNQNGTLLSKTTALKTEVITAAGLCKMACCNLAESFENSASVTVGYSDAITGARQIRLLGLNGMYTQMLDENRPALRGLAAPFGLAYVPGQWLESIQIAKGPSSVVNGLEAITGQINMEHRKPTDEKPLFVNLYLGDNLRSEANIASSLQLNNKLSTVILAHASYDPLGHDGNHDGFRDEPVASQFNVSNRWLYIADNGMQFRAGIKLLKDDRLAGQSDFKKGEDNMTSQYWGSEIINQGMNGYVKLGIPLNKDNSSNIAGVIDYTYHKLESFFGRKNYNGEQNSLFVNLIYQNEFNEKHKLVAGLNGVYDKFDENLEDYFFTGNIGGQNHIPLSSIRKLAGAYAEYTYTGGEKVSVVTGLRVDRYSRYGYFIAPRFNLKYSFTGDLIFRANAGRGIRNSNIIPDNLGILSTGREIKIDLTSGLEDAWTAGANLTGYFNLGKGEKSTLSVEYFRTWFNSQVIVDQERDYSKIWIYNLDGRSYTNNWQADFTSEPVKRFKILATMRFTDAKATLEGQGLTERPLTSRYKGVLNLQYATSMNIWTFDFTAQLNGPSKMPSFVTDMRESPSYTILFAQITRRFKDLDIYIGGENLTGYKQMHPIMSADNPFSEGFNSTVVWGPLMGARFYAGLRFTIWK